MSDYPCVYIVPRGRSIAWPTSSGVYPEILRAIPTPYAEGVGCNGWLKTAVLPDGVREILLQEFTFEWRGRRFTVPEAFVFDYASVPRFFQRVLPQRGKYSAAAVCHDYLYWSGKLTRKNADKVFGGPVGAARRWLAG